MVSWIIIVLTVFGFMVVSFHKELSERTKTVGRISIVLLGTIVILVNILITGQIPDRPAIPIGQVYVDGVKLDSNMRMWCNAEKPCTMVPPQTVNWEVQRDGAIKIMSFNGQMCFKRGYFEDPAEGDYPHWVPSPSGEYLLATDGTLSAYIIHYPLPEPESMQTSEQDTQDQDTQDIEF